MAAEDALGRQFSDRFKPPGDMVRPAHEYPTTGYRKKTDRVKAQIALMGASRGYDVHVDMIRKGLTVNPN